MPPRPFDTHRETRGGAALECLPGQRKLSRQGTRSRKKQPQVRFADTYDDRFQKAGDDG